VAVGAFFLFAAISRGRLGRLLGALSETPTMLSTHGLSVNVTRLIVFCASAFFAGIGGALLITTTGAASGVAFGPIQSLLLLAVLAMCGTRLLRSSITAAVLLAIVPGYVSGFDADKQLLGFGLVAIAAALIISRRAAVAAWVAAAARTSVGRPVRRPLPVRVSRPSAAKGGGSVVMAAAKQ
jgi:ABC-type branched-subunit amino acid transport system permease subunit